MGLRPVLVVALLGSAGLASAACTPRPREASTPPVAEATLLDFENAIAIEPRLAKGEVVVTVRLKEGFHVYTTGESVGRPLRISVADAGDWEATGDPTYPAGTRKETTSGPSVVVEREAEVVLPVEATVPSPRPLEGRLQYQVCTETACDRPRELAFSLAHEG